MRPIFTALLFASASFACAAADARPVRFAAEAPQTGALVLPLGSEADLAAAPLDAASRSAVQRAVASAAFDYSEGSALTLRGIGPWSQIVLLGTGTEPLGGAALQELGGRAMVETMANDGPVTIAASRLAGPAAQLAVGAALRAYAFDRYKSSDPARPKAAGREAALTIVAADPAAAEQAYARDGRAVAEAVAFVRDLINEPANVVHPEAFVERTREAFRGVAGVSIEALDVAAMEKLGMGSILSVGKGSARPPRMLIVHYKGSDEAPVVLAGKGITFDSGGISLKPGSGMWEMKGDMSGAAAVTGAVLSLAKAKAPVNVVAIAALAENMPGGAASRPGDIVRAYKGKTIEIINTDAEGRLVLADAVSYAERRFKPAAIVDLATLTGAKVAALGDEYAALFSRQDALAAQLEKAGEAAGEPLWRLPLHKNYAKDMDSAIADIQNVAEGGGPGAGLGAHFIGYFVTEATPWAHLDIAGNEMGSGSDTGPEGATGFGVRLLDRFVRDFRPVPASTR